jgi:hypothetical protein
MLDAVNGKLLLSREEDLLHSRYPALLCTSEAIDVHQDLNGITAIQERSYGRSVVVTESHIRGC